MRTLSLRELAAMRAALYVYKGAGFGRDSVRPNWVQMIASDNGRVRALDDRGIESMVQLVEREIARLERDERDKAA